MTVLKKILFTDLFGTLISPDIDISKKYFGNLDRECKFVCQYLNEFLSKGNDVVVVTGPNGHDRLDFIFNHILAKIDSSIAPHLRSHIAYYLQGEADFTKATLFI